MCVNVNGKSTKGVCVEECVCGVCAKGVCVCVEGVRTVCGKRCVCVQSKGSSVCVCVWHWVPSHNTAQYHQHHQIPNTQR